MQATEVEGWLLERVRQVEAVAGAAAAAVAGSVAAPRLLCAHCRSDWPTNTMACPTCGGPMQPLVPLTVHCGFCSCANRRDLTDLCTSCGGPLPALPGGMPGGEPPPPPRRLPPSHPAPAMAQTERDSKRAIGLVFVVLGVLGLALGIGLLFIAIGAMFAFKPQITNWLEASALRNGHATRGRILGVVGTDRGSYTAYKIHYTFEDGTKKRRASCVGFDPSHAGRRAGDETWVVHVPGQAWLRRAIWPPVR